MKCLQNFTAADLLGIPAIAIFACGVGLIASFVR